jgi:hypothetical protein
VGEKFSIAKNACGFDGYQSQGEGRDQTNCQLQTGIRERLQKVSEYLLWICLQHKSRRARDSQNYRGTSLRFGRGLHEAASRGIVICSHTQHAKT